MKFCDDRKKNYCLKTTIWKDKEKKYVTKEALFTEGIVFLEDIANYADVLKSFYSKVTVCPVKLKDNILFFDYISGHDLESLYLEAMVNNDKERFTKLLNYHVSIIEGDESNRCEFISDDYFKEYFGNGDFFDGELALKISNYDATASNIIIKKNEAVFIDYEWVFEKPIPRNIVVYHCIRELYEHNSGLEKFFPFKDALEIVNCIKSIDLLENAYWQFFEYVNGSTMEMTFSKKKVNCLKRTENIEDFKQHKRVLEAELIKSINENTKISVYWQECSQANAKLSSELQNYKELVEKQNESIEPLLSAYHRIRSAKSWKALKKIRRLVKKN